MQKTYIEYPEISTLKANITSRRSQGDQTQIILDRTIFMPDSEEFVKDHGDISGMEIIAVEEKRDNIIHTVIGKPQKSEVVLSLDLRPRSRNLTYNTAAILFKILMRSLYNFKDISLKVADDSASITVIDFYDLLDKDLIESQINYLIAKSLKISNWQGITSISPLGEVVNNEICFDRTSKVLGIKILDTSQDDDDLIIEFKAGSDLLNN